jgi:IS4 transposase
LVKYGFQVGKKPTKDSGKKQLKFTIGLKGMLPSDAHLFTDQVQPSEDISLREAIVNSSHTKDSIVVFDRGLQKRKSLDEFDGSGIYFVTRANDYIKYEQIDEYKKISGRVTSTLVFDKDILVHLYDGDNQKIKTPFRLIKAKSKQSGEPILFLTNIKHLKASEISEIYSKRWDIEVFFRFIKQELDFTHLLSYNENGTRVMMYMILVTAMLILVYKKVNNIDGYKIAKLKLTDELQMEITKEIVVACGGDPKKMKKIYNLN